MAMQRDVLMDLELYDWKMLAFLLPSASAVAAAAESVAAASTAPLVAAAEVGTSSS